MNRPIFLLLSSVLTASADVPAISNNLPGLRGPGGVSHVAGSAFRIEADQDRHGFISPSALGVDDLNRIFITEARRCGRGVADDRNNTEWYLDDLAAQTVEDRLKLHQKWPGRLSLEEMTRHSEVVRRLADANGDGELDESVVYADDFNDPLDGNIAGIFHYEGTSFLGCVPAIYALRDEDGDGKAEKRITIAEGFGVRISLSGHDLSGFALGPDGRIYGTMGDRGFSVTTREGVRLHHPNEGAVFRFDPDGSGFELYHTGLRNPREIAFDEEGNAFTVDNNSDQGDKARIVYLIDGGDSGWEMEHQTMHTFHRQIGLENRPPNRWMDEHRWEPANATQPAFMLPPVANFTNGPSGMVRHPGSGFLASEAGRFFVCDYRGSAANSGVWSFAVKPDGAGMKFVDARRILWGVAATDVDFTWDGRMMVTDFLSGWRTHEKGRLVSLTATDGIANPSESAGTPALIKAGFEHRSSAELLNLLRHPDFRIRLRAQLALTRKDDALKRLTTASESTKEMVRRHGIWGLGILLRRGGAVLPGTEFAKLPSLPDQSAAEKQLVKLAGDGSAAIRMQAIRALVDAGAGSANLPLAVWLADDSPRVRLFAALLAGKRKAISYYGPVCDMLRENDDRDPYLRHAGAYALQRMVSGPAELVALRSDTSSAVRLAAVIALRGLRAPDVSLFLTDDSPAVAAEAIRAVCDLDLSDAEQEVAALLDDPSRWRKDRMMIRRLLHHAFRLGGVGNFKRILAVAADVDQSADARNEALRLVSLWRKPPDADQFTGHWEPLPERDTKDILPFLRELMPKLLQDQGTVLAAALRLLEVYQLGADILADQDLAAMASNGGLPAAARSAALTLLVKRNPASLQETIISLAEDPSDEIALFTLRALYQLAPDQALRPLIAAIDLGRPALARSAWSLLAKSPAPEVEALFVEHLGKLRDSFGVSPWALELLDAAHKCKSGAVQAALAEYESTMAAATDPLAKWNPVLEGGDPARGETIFLSHPASECMRCHRVGGGHDAAGDTAPNLAGVAHRLGDRRSLLESLIDPSAVIAPGFGLVSIEFKNGATMAASLVSETDAHLIVDAEARRLRVKRGDIASLSKPVSAMPSMAEALKPAELRDTVAWLASLTEQDPTTPPEPEIIDFDPETLSATPAPEAPEGIDPAQMKLGATQFLICSACHGRQGEGGAAGPPLAGSEWVNGPVENLIRIQLRGLQGPITVKGTTYEFPAGMAAMAYQTDEQVAAVLTYVRNSFGNQAPAVTAAEVAKFRDEVGKPPLQTSELISPTAAETPAARRSSAEAADSGSNKYQDLKPASSRWPWAVLGLAVISAVIILLKRRPTA
jgi:quinoprotein glucose dehydrogenase